MYNQFDDILDRLNAGKLYDFPGGVEPMGMKELSNQEQIKTLPLPKSLFVTVKMDQFHP